MQRSLTFSGGLIAIVIAAVLLIIYVCDAQPKDAPAFAALIAVPLVIAIGAALLGQRYGLWRRFQHIGAALFVVYAIGAVLVLITMLTTTSMMFISQHDAEVAVVITVYATGVTLVFGHFVVNSLSDGIATLTHAAMRVQDGDLAAKADDRGNDELSKLAHAFNQMTGRLLSAREMEVQSNQARREWIAWVSHDLRTPLTSLRARAEALADGVVTRQDEVGDYLGAIRRDADTLNRLIDDLAELAKIDAGGLKLDKMPVDLGDLVSDTLHALRVLADDRGVALSGEPTGELAPVMVSPQHIQRVLNNLVGNALAHTPRGGQVIVRCARMPDLRETCVEVLDTGEGIPAQDLPLVFERFYRGERSRRRDMRTGMGLGLVIARELVEAHGGRIGIESMPGRGTRAWFTLPS
jgi:signal transduction histidine kinase